jgi:hypothetical protein
MTSEWLRIMLDEIARKDEEARQGRDEEIRRRDERAAEHPDVARDRANPGDP